MKHEFERFRDSYKGTLPPMIIEALLSNVVVGNFYMNDIYKLAQALREKEFAAYEQAVL